MAARLTDTGAIEHRLLELAYTTDAKITAPALAFYAPCSLDDAEQVLDALTTRDRLTMEVDDDGTIFYELRARQKLSAPIPPTAIVRAPVFVPGPSPGLAAILSMFVPGAGHLYAGRVIAGLLWFLVVSAGYVLLLPGLVLHLFNIVSATGAAARSRLAMIEEGPPMYRVTSSLT